MNSTARKGYGAGQVVAEEYICHLPGIGSLGTLLRRGGIVSATVHYEK